MANTLFLWLEGPLQAWGERANWAVRDSAPEPTKSGLIGLLGCALGVADDDALRDLSRRVAVGVRCDRPGTRRVDYHTVVGGALSAEGKVKVNAATHEPETVVSWREYLCDASFLAAVRSGDAALIARLAEAVQAPRWPLYLGRKACPPSRPVYDGVGDYPTLRDALQKGRPVRWPRPRADEALPQATRVRIVLEGPREGGALRRDELLSRRYRQFGPRYVEEYLVEVPVRPWPEEEAPCTSRA